MLRSFFIQGAGLASHHDEVVYLTAAGAYHQPKAAFPVLDNIQCFTCGNNIENVHKEHVEEIHKIIEPVMYLFEKYLESRMQAIKQSRYSVIFPQFPYEDKRRRAIGCGAN